MHPADEQHIDAMARAANRAGRRRINWGPLFAGAITVAAWRVIGALVLWAQGRW